MPPPAEPLSDGLEIALVDAAAVGIALAAVRSKSSTVGYAAFATYALGGPIVHWAHGSEKGLASMGMRLTLPAVGGLVGFLIGGSIGRGKTNPNSDCACDWGDALPGLLTGFSVGVALAMVSDWFWLGHDEPPEPFPTWSMYVGGRTLTLQYRF